MIDLLSECELLVQSSLFDAEYQVQANADVAAVSIDPLVHYLVNKRNRAT